MTERSWRAEEREKSLSILIQSSLYLNSFVGSTLKEREKVKKVPESGKEEKEDEEERMTKTKKWKE